MDKRYSTMLEVLEHMRKRPAMWIGKLTISTVDSFLRGFAIACELLEPASKHTAIYREVVAEHGWTATSPQPVWHQMQERGLEEQAIIDELMTIEYEVWKQIASQTADETDTEV